MRESIAALAAWRPGSLSFHSIWWYIGHQSLRLHHDSIFVRLPAINWQCRHIGGPHIVVGRLLWLVGRRGTHCQNVYVIPLLVLLFLPVFWKHSSSQSTSVSSALEALAMMHYINLRFTLHYNNPFLTVSKLLTPNIVYCWCHETLVTIHWMHFRLTGICAQSFYPQKMNNRTLFLMGCFQRQH